MDFNIQIRWLSSQGPQCSALSEVVCGVSRCNHMNAVCVYIWHNCVNRREIGIFIVCQLLANFATSKYCTSALFFKKSLSIMFTPWVMFVPISAFLLFLVSEVVCGE